MFGGPFVKSFEMWYCPEILAVFIFRICLNTNTILSTMAAFAFTTIYLKPDFVIAISFFILF